MKRYITIIISLIMILLIGCSEKNNINQPSIPETEDRLQIGMCFDSFVIERWQRDRDIFVATAKELGADVNVQNANGDIDTQIEQINYFIDSGMDVIVIICIDSDSLSEAVEKAKNAGIKVIAYDRLINNADIDLYISFDNEMVGTLMGEALVDAGLEGGNVIMIGGSVADNNVSLVENGFNDVMNANDICILDSTHCDGWKAEIAADYIAENAELVEQADAIMCGNDDIASQVITSLAELRLAGSIYVTGQDADLIACQRIVEGTQLMTVYKPVENLAKCAAELAVELGNGESIEDDGITYISNGSYETAYLGLEPICVTADNMDEIIISSGFHQKDDVYLNVNTSEN